MLRKDLKDRLAKATGFNEAAGIIFYAIMNQNDRAITLDDGSQTKRLTLALKIWNKAFTPDKKAAIAEMRKRGLKDYAKAIEEGNFSLIKF